MELHLINRACVRKSRRITSLRENLKLAEVVISHYADKDRETGNNESPAAILLQSLHPGRPNGLNAPEVPLQPEGAAITLEPQIVVSTQPTE